MSEFLEYNTQFMQLPNVRGLIEGRINTLTDDADRWADEAAQLAQQLAQLDLGVPEISVPGAFTIPDQTVGFAYNGNLGNEFDPTATGVNPFSPSFTDITAVIEPFTPDNIPEPNLSLSGFSAPISVRPSTTVGPFLPFNDPPPDINITPYVAPPENFGAPPTKVNINIPTFVDPPDRSAPEFTGDLTLEPAPVLDADLTLPDFPVLDTNLSIPDELVLELDRLSVERPDFTEPLPFDFDTLGFMDSATDQLTALRPDDNAGVSVLDSMAAGQTGLPIAIEQALFDRAIVRDDKKSRQDLDQAMGEWARRGFSMPGSTILQKLASIRQANRESTCTVGRELAIQLHQEQLASIRLAVEQGVRYQGQLFEFYRGMAAVAAQLTSTAAEVAKAIFDGRLSIFRVRLEIYKADVEAYSEYIRAELAKVEIYKGQLEGARLRGELNEQQVRIYTARIAALGQIIENYQTEVNAYRAKVEAKGLEIDQFRVRVQAFGEEINADRNKVEAYRARVQAEGTKGDIYASEVRGFAELVNAYRSRVDAARTAVEASVAESEGRVRVYATQADTHTESEKGKVESQATVRRSETDAYRVDLETGTALERTRLEAENSYNRALIDQFTALKRSDTELATARTSAAATNIQAQATRLSAEADAWAAGERGAAERIRAAAAKLSALIENERLGLDAATAESEARRSEGQLNIQALDGNNRVAIARAQQYVEQLRTLASLSVEQISSAAQVQAQLAASALSAVNLSAGVDDRSSSSASQGSTYNLSERVAGT